MHTFTTAAVLTMALQAQAHMWLYKPTRFTETGDNSPLVGPGAGTSDYPCKVLGNYGFEFDRTQIPLGSVYEVVFQGESVHGGGSCQFSLSKDLEPNAQSEFKVIHSIEGGCPARNTPGNLGADDSATTIDPYKYNFTMPSDIPTGKYTFAWTWFNKVGNREMYMNCAPIEVTAGSNKRSMRTRDTSALDKLPDVFLANIPDVKCTTSDYPGDMSYPDPGDSVEQNVPASERSQPVLNGAKVEDCYAPVKAQAAGSPSSSPGSYGGYTPVAGGTPTPSPATPAPSPGTPAPSPGTPTPSPGTPAPSPGGHNPTPVASPSPLATPSPVTPSPNASSPITSPASGSCGIGKVSCPSPGSVVCIGSTHFGLCDLDHCAVAQALAAGTSCSSGTISKRALWAPPQAHANRLYELGHRLFNLF